MRMADFVSDSAGYVVDDTVVFSASFQVRTVALRCTAVEKLRIGRLHISGGIAHEVVSRRPPISLDTIVACTGGYT
jgi:hypothetical protein